MHSCSSLNLKALDFLSGVGPGGIRCSCCAPIRGKMKKQKKFVNRLARRKLKQELARDEDFLINRVAVSF